MRTLTKSFHGNPNIGLYGYCAEAEGKRILLLGERIPQDAEEEIAEALQATIHHVMIAGTPMPGVFLAGNANALLVPAITFDRELQALRKLGLRVMPFETRLTCLGNNLVANEHGCLVNPEFSDAEIKRLYELLKVPVKRMKIADIDTPGACVVLNGRKGIIHRDAADFEIEIVKQTLHLESLEPASVNLGSPYLKAGVLNNDEALIVGDQSGGPEIVHLEQSLGYLEER